MTNRKLHTRFRLVLKSTLDDLEGPLRTIKKVQTHDELHFTGIAAAAAADDDDDDDDDDDEDELYIDEGETQQTSTDATFCYLASCVFRSPPEKFE